ncbi:sigma factor-like helix-turn-helix DNA-binding protein [Nocardioides currus]|nr:sigma factor-like helix-turn-helix DNA-binding protein [Nocardioides currus]
MTTSIDWVHEIDASLEGVDQPTASYALPTGEAFSDYVAERGPHVRRLAHAICCDWTQAEALVLGTLSGLYDAWSAIQDGAGADAFVHRALARAVVTDSPTPRSCNAHGDDYPIEDESLLFDGLQSLSTIQRKALVLHDWLDLPVEEVADAVGISPELVVLHAARGRSALNFLLPESA